MQGLINTLETTFKKSAMIDDLNFDIPVERTSIIKVIGVGGGGSNAVNHMFKRGIRDVNFVVCNTDAQALSNSPVSVKIQLGEALTEGRGAGNKPAIGRQAALEASEVIKEVLAGNTKMVFITAGMGGGTGTGAAPVIAKIAKEMGILTVAIVTVPFRFEGEQRINQAIEGINEIQKYVDSLLLISNEKLREIYGDLKISQAFSRADDVLATAAKGIAEIITVHGYINVDFADVETVMSNSGVAVLGSASASGEGRALMAIKNALSSPLLNNNDITGAKSILLNITSGSEEATMDEVGEITDYVSQASDKSALIIWGTGIEDSLGDSLNVTVIATGFEMKSIPDLCPPKRHKDTVILQEGNVRPSEQTFGTTIKNINPSPDFILDDEKPQQYTLFDETIENPFKADDNTRRQERVKNILKIQEFTRSASQSGHGSNDKIDQLENEPAFVRKQIKIDVPQSGTIKSNISKFSLSDDDENTPRLREDNSYLHDNVD
jgi:cell division protein FtsZ